MYGGNANGIFVGKPQGMRPLEDFGMGEKNIKVDGRYGVGKRSLERPMCRWEDNIRMDLQRRERGVWTGFIYSITLK
jgi:hypothetical protein